MKLVAYFRFPTRRIEASCAIRLQLLNETEVQNSVFASFLANPLIVFR
ncbi:MAG: hypothetical protein FD138_3163 [Planctomycetota bacterium]|nr:MAG: hypothetical protein FD138_3163 [Planctomycetota bacterium]